MGKPRIDVRRVLVAADQFSEDHLRRITEVARGWAEVERISQEAPAEAFVKKLDTADVLVGWASGEILVKSRIKAYLCGSAGVDGYFGKGLEAKKDLLFTNAAGTMTVPIAEHVLALMFALARHVPQILAQQAQKKWERRWMAEELAGTSVCIVGFGAAGSELARRCQGLGLRVSGVRRNPQGNHPHAEKLYPISQLKAAVAEADRVVVLLPGGPATRRLIDGEVFSAMKRGASFFNASRGSVVDEKALIDHLISGHLASAGIDVFEKEPLSPDSPLWTMQNVIVSPHSAGLSNKLADRLCGLMCENLKRLREGRDLVNQIDLAALSGVKP